MSHVWIALGSNLGDRAAHLAAGVEGLSAAGLAILRVSHVYETAPEHDADEPPYLNAVIQAESDRDPHEILRLLQTIEEQEGRRPVGHPARSGSRTIDLDLLAVGVAREEGPELVLPHPRLHRRSFVLVPLCEIDPGWTHPTTGESAAALLARLGSRPGEVRLHGTIGAGPSAASSDYPWRHASAVRRGG